MTDYRVLDLFSGLGGFSAAFADSERWAVTTVEIDPDFEPDVVADVFELRPSDFDREFDVILASPPCTQFSTIRSVTQGGDDAWINGEPGTDAAADALALVHHTEGLIRGLSPVYWFVENPRGRLRTFWKQPETTVWYCQYGHENAKPTDLWGDHPPMTYRKCWYGNDACGHVRTQSYKEHGGGSDNVQGILQKRDPAERAKVPYQLSEAIRDACTAALDGDAPVQTTAEEWGAV